MDIIIFSKLNYKLIGFLAINVLIIFSEPFQAKPQEYKQFAIIEWLSKDVKPLVSEQILLKKTKDELVNFYDLRYQTKFEIALHKIKHLSPNENCEHLECILKAHSGFEKATLFLLKSEKEGQRLSLIKIGKNKQWHVKHEVCQMCGLTQEDMIKNVVFKLENYFRKNIIFDEKRSENEMESVYSSNDEPTEIIIDKRKKRKALLKVDNRSDKKLDLLEKKSSQEKLKFKIAQRQYNLLIWKKIKKELMFFRRKNRNFSIKKLKARLRLQIDKFGRVIERSLVDKSGSEKFDKRILESVDILKLPPPMKNLIKNPPYVVTILIQP